jgi:adenylate cyclase
MANNATADPLTAPARGSWSWWPAGWGRRPHGEGIRARVAKAIEAEEQAGLRFAFMARCAAVLVVALWLPSAIEAERVPYYLAFVAAFFVLGLLPHLLRRHRFARAFRLGFTVLDVMLIATVIIVPPPDAIALDWPVQMRVRFSEYLYLVLLIVGSALSYSPVYVLWTGFWVIVVWTTGVLTLYYQPDTVRFADVIAGIDPVPPGLLLQTVLSPTYVSPTQLQNQVVLTAILTGLLAAAVARSRRMLLRHTAAEVARADLARYVSPDVLDAIITSRRDFGEPTTREVAVLFADIVGFTALAERLPPTRMVTLLTSFHSRACRVVFRHGGTLDKYLGDGFMAVFGTLADEPDAPARAVRCALELQAEMDRWNAKRAARGAFTVQLAIGIHCGRVVVGNLGLTRDHGRRIAVSEICLTAAGTPEHELAAFEKLGPVHLPGRTQPIEVRMWPRAARASG